MPDDVISWIAWTAVAFDAVIVVWIGRMGPQPVLMPRSLIYGRTTTLHAD